MIITFTIINVTPNFFKQAIIRPNRITLSKVLIDFVPHKNGIKTVFSGLICNFREFKTFMNFGTTEFNVSFNFILDFSLIKITTSSAN